MPRREIYNNGILQSVTDPRTPADAIAEAVDRLQASYATAIAQGYADPTTGITLAIADGDRAQLDALDNHLTRKGEAADAMTAIIDRDGVVHPVTVGDFRALIVRAGDYYLGLRMSLAQKTQQAAAAATVDDADGVQW